MRRSPIDPIEVLRRMPPGTAIYTREQIDGGLWEVAWLVREETSRIEKLGPHPIIEYRAGLIEHDSVCLLPALVRVGVERPENIFETWINAHAEGIGLAPVEELAIQPRIITHLYGDGCQLVRSVVIPNRLQGFFQEALRKLASNPAWTMAEFNSSREKLYQHYPKGYDLWKALGKGEK